MQSKNLIYSGDTPSSEFNDLIKFKNYNLICSISILLYCANLIINYTVGMKTGEVSKNTFYLEVTPPGLFFIIWAFIFTSTFVAIIWACIKIAMNRRDHLYFWCYCISTMLWSLFWSFGKVSLMVICMFLLMLTTLSLFLLWSNNMKNTDKRLGTCLLRQTIAFQMGWCASAQCLNIATFLVYTSIDASQQLIQILIWPLLIISHGLYILMALNICMKSGKSFWRNFSFYQLSALWAVSGIISSYTYTK